MSDRLAACSCGQLSARVTGEPVRISVCHCLACQRRTGSVFAAQVRFPRAAVTIAGASAEYVRVGGGSRGVDCIRARHDNARAEGRAARFGTVLHFT
jgi:hypothetical protein